MSEPIKNAIKATHGLTTAAKLTKATIDAAIEQIATTPVIHCGSPEKPHVVSPKARGWTLSARTASGCASSASASPVVMASRTTSAATNSATYVTKGPAMTDQNPDYEWPNHGTEELTKVAESLREYAEFCERNHAWTCVDQDGTRWANVPLMGPRSVFELVEVEQINRDGQP